MVVGKGGYICPMCSDIWSKEADRCPKCGMLLELRVISQLVEPNPEIVDMTFRLKVGILLTIPVFLLAMGGMLPGLGEVLSSQWAMWAQFGLSIPVVFWAGKPF